MSMWDTCSDMADTHHQYQITPQNLSACNLIVMSSCYTLTLFKMSEIDILGRDTGQGMVSDTLFGSQQSCQHCRNFLCLDDYILCQVES